MINRQRFLLILGVFLAFYFLPLNNFRMQLAILEAFYMVQEYAQKHVLFCLIPAFFIAGAISLFISKEAVIKYFGAKANKVLAYVVASISGTILSVCSCTVLPIFAGIYTRGAGIGPATAFLYSGPAINVLAIIITARILGVKIGIARAISAIVLSLVIGILMSVFFKDKKSQTEDNYSHIEPSDKSRSLIQNALYFLLLILILIFAAWSKPQASLGFYYIIYSIKWYLVIGLLAALIFILAKWFNTQERKDWLLSTWMFAEQILPLLFVGIFVAGFLFGRPNSNTGLIPSQYITSLLGSNSIVSNIIAAISGAIMYFATLTEVPILQGLLGSGMGKGPALALLLAGPAVSLPSILVLRSIMGDKKTLTYLGLVIILSSAVGWIYGNLF
ncbi:MAG: permease [candidate division WOR-3 bacterium]|nr:permease [candidate division WOR-3 bacterium]MCX7756897.1 permease [candidate division WOR-3 bacterium]MDW7987379.1 permease [candidate division WOR-3 bacterium]